MTGKTHIWIDAPRDSAGARRQELRIERPGQPAMTIWFRTPLEYAGWLSERADAYAIIAVFTAMRAGAPAVVHGEVSPSLIRNLEEFQAAWASWFPQRYRVVELTADVERERVGESDAGRTLAAFSGGVDAAFSLYRHQRGLAGRRSRPVGAGLLIHGYDIPVADDTMFAPACARARRMTESLGVPLIPVATNYREVEPLWEDVHMVCVGACLSLFEGAFDTALVGSSEPYRKLVIPWASNPVTDHLLSSAGFRIVHDGAECNRIDKLTLLRDWEEAQQELFVCWEPTASGRNCCRCNKCVRTILNYRVMGWGLPPCFDRDVDDVTIAGMRGLNDTMVADLEVILRAADAQSLRAPWVTALEQVVRRYHFRNLVGKNPLVIGLRTNLDRHPVGRRVWDLVRRR
ncbi:MAG TPA: hypothetical protein VFS21_22665 [Roseiflexaceae bacterium]|nr:hypothetical protein [Roseiflexaceae bacterium]